MRLNEKVVIKNLNIINLSHKSIDRGVLRDHSSVARLGEPGRGVIDIQELDPDHHGGGLLVTPAPWEVSSHHPEAVTLCPLPVKDFLSFSFTFYQ